MNIISKAEIKFTKDEYAGFYSCGFSAEALLLERI